MTHLGRLVSALVDGELSHDERDRALAHLATCEQCRAAVEAERALKATVGRIDVGVPSSALLSGLMRLAEPGEPLPPVHRSFPGSGGPASVGWRTPTHQPFGQSAAPMVPASTGSRSRHQGLSRQVVYAAGGLVGLAAVTVGLVMAGGSTLPDGGGTPVVPPVEEMTVEHVQRNGGQPFADPSVFLDDVATPTMTGSR